jgi:hypothetical protein
VVALGIVLGWEGGGEGEDEGEAGQDGGVHGAIGIEMKREGKPEGRSGLVCAFFENRKIFAHGSVRTLSNRSMWIKSLCV